jgi:uncharacterized protein HemX
VSESEEHDLPTEKSETIGESPQIKQARLWIHLDSVAHKIEDAAKELRAESEGAGKPAKSVAGQVHAAEHANVNNVRIDLGGMTLLVVLLLTIIIGAGGVVMGIDISDRHAQQREFDRRAQQSQREDDERIAQTRREEDARSAMLAEKLQDLQRQYRMTELKLDDWSVVAHRSGLVLPGDYTRGPQGNLDSQAFKPPKRR